MHAVIIRKPFWLGLPAQQLPPCCWSQRHSTAPLVTIAVSSSMHILEKMQSDNTMDISTGYPTVFSLQSCGTLPHFSLSTWLISRRWKEGLLNTELCVLLHCARVTNEKLLCSDAVELCSKYLHPFNVSVSFVNQLTPQNKYVCIYICIYSISSISSFLFPRHFSLLSVELMKLGVICCSFLSEYRILHKLR